MSMCMWPPLHPQVYFISFKCTFRGHLLTFNVRFSVYWPMNCSRTTIAVSWGTYKTQGLTSETSVGPQHPDGILWLFHILFRILPHKQTLDPGRRLPPDDSFPRQEGRCQAQVLPAGLLISGTWWASTPPHRCLAPSTDAHCAVLCGSHPRLRLSPAVFLSNTWLLDSCLYSPGLLSNYELPNHLAAVFSSFYTPTLLHLCWSS